MTEAGLARLEYAQYCADHCFSPTLRTTLQNMLGPTWVLLVLKNMPAEVIAAHEALCRTDYTSPEDLQVFLDWAEVAVIEAVLGDDL